MVGVVRLRVSGRAGQTPGSKTRRDPRCRWQECLPHPIFAAPRPPTPSFSTGGGEESFAAAIYTCTASAMFEVSGLEGEVPASTITGLVYHSATPITGEFECSNAKLNQLQHNILWARRETSWKCPPIAPSAMNAWGGTGDAQVFCRTATFNADVQPFFGRWMIDVQDAQVPSGSVHARGARCPLHKSPALCRQQAPRHGAMPASSSRGPFTRPTATDASLSASYDSMVRYIGYLEERCQGGPHPEVGFGDLAGHRFRDQQRTHRYGLLRL